MEDYFDDPGLAPVDIATLKGPKGWDFSKAKPGLAGAIVQALAIFGTTSDTGQTASTFLGEAGKALVEVRRVQPEKVPGTAASLLVSGAVSSAFHKLFPDPQSYPEGISLESIQERIEAQEWKLYKSPRRIEFLKDIQALPGCHRFADYFVMELGTVLRASNDFRETLSEYVRPLLDRSREAQSWIEYGDRRIQEAHESLLGENCCLIRLFVKPLAYRIDQRNTIVDLWADTLPKWIESTDKADCLRLIYGGPGAGKSSLTKMLMTGLTEGKFPTSAHCRAVRIPIHELGKPLQGTWNMVSLRDRLNDMEVVPFAVEQTGAFPLDGADRLVLIFDGLDELEALGGQGAEDAIVLVETIRRLLADLNSKERRVLGVITGRDMVMEAVAQAAGDGKRKYHLQPYPVNPTNLPGGRDPLNEWWTNYQRAVEETEEPTGVPKELLERQDLHEILAEPLLNFLLARALKNEVGPEKRVDPKTVTLNELYARFLKDVYERVWEQPASEAHDVKHARGFTFSQFQRVLSAVGVEIWHGGGIRADKAAIAQRCQAEKIVDAWEKVTEQCTRDVGKLLMAFYLRHHTTEDDYGLERVEFTHKSFGEYLTALRIIAELDSAVKEKDTKTALISWVKLFGEQSMWSSAGQIFRFVEAEIEVLGQTEPGRVQSWQRRLTEFAEHIVAHGMPVDEVHENRNSFQREQEQSRNAEEALLTIVGACWQVTGAFYTISTWPQQGYRPQAWLNRLRGDSQVLMGEWPLLKNCLYGLVAIRADLTGADLTQTLIFDFKFVGANLSGANMSSAYWKGGILAEVNLSSTNLKGANFEESDLTGANLSGAQLTGADLKSTILKNANLDGAELSGAFLSGADLTGASLRGAGLSGAYFLQSNITNADFTRAMLNETHFGLTTFTGAKLRDAMCWSKSTNELRTLVEIAKERMGGFPDGLPEEVKERLLQGLDPA